MSMAPESIPEVVIRHLDAYQQHLIQSDDEADATEVQARATLMRRELEKCFIRPSSNNNKNNSLDDSNDLSDDTAEEEADIYQVTATLVQCVDSCMAASDASSSNSKDAVEIVHGMLQLVVCFAAQWDKSDTTIPALVGRAIQYSSSILERVRIHACKLLGYSVYYSCQKHQESVQAARKTMIARLTDKSQAVRNAAIGASSFFFTSSSSLVDEHEHDVLLESLLWNMAHDPSAANRIAALESIPVNSNTTLNSIIARVRDEKVKVRVQALVTLGDKANGLASSEQFAQMVRSSLGNRCAATKEAATRMICASWMKHVRFDPIALIGLLDPVLYEQECHKVCQILFQVAQEESPTALEELSAAEIRAFQQGVSSASSTLAQMNTADTYLEPRAVLFCKSKCDFLQSSNTTLSPAQQELAISKIVPQVAVLCDWLELHISRLVESIQEQDDDDDDEDESNDMLQEEDIFVSSQLLQMAQATDLKEEGSRRHFIAAMKKLLVAIETPDELLEGSIKALLFAHQEEAGFLQTISDVISDLSTLYTHDNEETDSGILQNVSTLRIITILAITLENTSASMALDSTLQGFSFYIVPAITSRHALVREGGVSCLGRLAMLSDASTVLEEFKPLLLSVACNKDEKLEIRAQAIMAICDLSFLFSEMLDKSQDGVSFVPLLVELLGTSKPAVVAVAAEVASKLLFAGRTSDVNLLANLVVTYFDQDIASLENDEDDNDVVEIGSPVRMQQLLSLFFPAYGMRGTKCKSALVSCIEPMLSAVAERLSQKGVKVSDWSMARMVEYVESLLECTVATASNNDTNESSIADPNKQDDEEATTSNSQDEDASPTSQEPSYDALVAIQVSQFLLKKQESIKTTLVRQLCKTLGSTHIDVDITDSATLLKLKTNMDELGMSVTDSTCLRSLKPLMELLDSMDADGEDDDESTETEDDSDGESSLAEALEAIAVAERDSMETTEKENETDEQVVSVENDNGKGSSKSTRGRRRLASMN